MSGLGFSQTFGDFDIHKTGIYDYNTDKAISFDKFITTKGTWNK